MSDTRIDAVNISCRFKERELFSSFSYEFKEGNIYCFRGVTGCGKTTMLEILSGYQKPEKGKVTYIGEGRLCQQVCYFSCDNEVFENLTAEENLRLVTEEEEKIQSVLCLLGLEERKDTEAFLLSKGERARIGIGRILLSDKKVLVLDEPVGNLDRKNAELVFRAFDAIKKDHIILISSNDDMGTENFCDAVFQYQDGVFLLIKSEVQQTKGCQDKTKQRSRHSSLFIKKFLAEISRRTWKQKALLLPLILLFQFALCLSSMFLNANANQYISQCMEQYGIQGVALQQQEEPSPYFANGSFLSFHGKDSFFLFNEGNEFRTSYAEMKVTSKQGAVIPSAFSEEYQLTVGSEFSLSDSAPSLVVENIYSYSFQQSQARDFLRCFSGGEEKDVTDFLLPILISEEMAAEVIDLNVEIVPYGSDLLFRAAPKSFSSPRFFRNLDQNTLSFWKAKTDYNHIVRILFYVSLAFLFVLFLLLTSSLCLCFRKEAELFRFLDGNSRRSCLLTGTDLILSALLIMIGNGVLLASLKQMMEKALANFFLIQSRIPLFQSSLFLSSLLLLIDVALLSLSLVFLLSLYLLMFQCSRKRKD